LEFKGSEFIHAKRKKVFDFLTDPQHFSKGISDIQEIKILSPERFKVVAKLGVSVIKANFDMVFEVLEKVPPSHVRLRGHGLGAGGAVDLEVAIDLKGKEEETVLEWAAVITLSGMLASLGQRVLNAIADKLVKEVFENIHAAVESPDFQRPTVG
jgi:carbon monoxide dehydrogenase subunit G